MTVPAACLGVIALGITVGIAAGCRGGNDADGASARPGCVRRVEEVVVRGDSLRGLVEPGQTLSLWHGYYECERPRHGDLVAFRHPGLDAPIVKRVVAVAGDTFTVGEGTAACGRLGVNDAPVRTAAGREYCLDAAAMALLGTYARDYRGVVPADAVLLLGSGERSSLDSGRVGLVSRGDLLGRAMTRSP